MTATVDAVGDPWLDAELARRFRESARTSDRRAPLNAALARIIANDPSIATLLGHAPLEQQLPVLLLAAIHFELLGTPDHELARWYPNLTQTPRDPSDPGLAAVLGHFVESHTPALLQTLATRHVQTNEVGRTALIVAGLGDPSDELAGRPLAHLDVGASAGLNLLLDRVTVCYRSGEDEAVVSAESAAPGLEVVADVRGELPRCTTLPAIAARRGIDLHPVDLEHEASRRWLEACVWPDQSDRFARLVDAIELARSDPPDIVIGDAVDDLAEHAAELAEVGVPLVTTTWVLNYLPVEQQRAFVAELDRFGAHHDLVWVFAESPSMTAGLPHQRGQESEARTSVSRVTWFEGDRRVEHVAIAHPHGYWLHTVAGP